MDNLIPYARNARTHSDAQVRQLADSIREWGWTVPVLVDEAGILIAGHGRVLAARQLGLADIPVMVAAGWSDAQKRAYVLADNKLALNAGWDEDLLRAELVDLGEVASLAGFDAAEIAAFTAERTPGLTDPDDAPDLAPEAVTVSGDVWLLGRHRLVCGDSTDVAVVAKALAGVAPRLMVTDPPYGVEYDPGWRNDIAQAGIGQGAPGGRALGKVANDDRADWRDAWGLFPGEVAYIWHGGLHAGAVAESLDASRFDIRSQIIWAKSALVISRGHYHWQHEACWYAVRRGKSARWAGDRKQSTLWSIPRPQKSETGHGTQKPVECMKRPIENSSVPGDAIYDPFCGSGTTLIAGAMTGRPVHAIELSPLRNY
ncbi:MAG: DNA methyltransferase [Acetobacteraceae bacterium]|nr:DNA methyltransferase [Acetobacteraceae bacterium]